MTDTIKDAVREKYASVARGVLANEASSCCSRKTKEFDPITGELYERDQTAALPNDAVVASLGCGNPTMLAELHPGEVVLDLGSGGGIDVLLSAKRVGPSGKAYGLDMTDEMLALAEKNKREAGATNVEFLRGEIENIPLPENAVDVIISNCVINLSADKAQVLREAYRVLRPGGRFAVSDVVRRAEVPEELRGNVESWTECVAGALEVNEYVGLLEAAGFTDVTVEPTRIYDDVFMSAFVRAKKGART